MAVLLIHKTFDGEPVGVWTDAMESYYTPGQEALLREGRGIVEDRGYAVPWSVFAYRKQESTDYRNWWEVVDTTQGLSEALDTARERFFTQQSAITPRDR